MANVYDHIQEREARKERTAVLTSLPEPDLGGDTIEETMANVYDHIQEREARKDRSAVLTRLPEPDIGGDTIEETLSKTYDVIQARNRRDDETRDRREAPLKGNTIEETLGNVYDHIQEREARKDRSRVLTKRPEREFGGDRIEEANVWDRMLDKSEPGIPRGWSVPSDQSVPRGWGVPRERGVLWDGAKTKPSWGRQPKMPLAPTLDQVRGHLQVPEPPVDQRPDVNPLTARAPRNPFVPPAHHAARRPRLGALTQPRPVGPQGPQVPLGPQMPGSVPGPWSGAPIAPMISRGQPLNPGVPIARTIPRGQPFYPGAPVPSPFVPSATLPPVFGPRRGPIGWAGKSPGVFDQQRGRVRPDPLRPDRRTKLAPDIQHAVLMGYIPDPRFARFAYAAQGYWIKGRELHVGEPWRSLGTIPIQGHCFQRCGDDRCQRELDRRQQIRRDKLRRIPRQSNRSGNGHGRFFGFEPGILESKRIQRVHRRGNPNPSGWKNCHSQNYDKWPDRCGAPRGRRGRPLLCTKIGWIRRSRRVRRSL